MILVKRNTAVVLAFFRHLGCNIWVVIGGAGAETVLCQHKENNNHLERGHDHLFRRDRTISLHCTKRTNRVPREAWVQAGRQAGRHGVE